MVGGKNLPQFIDAGCRDETEQPRGFVFDLDQVVNGARLFYPDAVFLGAPHSPAFGFGETAEDSPFGRFERNSYRFGREIWRLAHPADPGNFFEPGGHGFFWYHPIGFKHQCFRLMLLEKRDSCCDIREFGWSLHFHRRTQKWEAAVENSHVVNSGDRPSERADIVSIERG